MFYYTLIMNLYKVTCSFGELIDKYTILKIKFDKIKEHNKSINIKKEILCLEKEFPIIKTNDSLFTDLFDINNKLWIFEDEVRIKSKNRQFDKHYIAITESIHKTNDLRFLVKKKINQKYNSYLIEEKSYLIDYPKNNDEMLQDGKMLYSQGKYLESYDILNKVIDTFFEYNCFDNFFVDLLFAYDNVCCILNIDNHFKGKIINVINILNDLPISNEFNKYIKTSYASHCLHNLNYICAGPYLKYLNFITGPNVSPDSISFFNKNDIDKSLLIYDGGGIGDKIMFARFIPILCERFNKNKIIFFTNKSLLWIFNDIFSNISNLIIISYLDSQSLPKYDYHCSLISLIYYLNFNYNTITFLPLLENIYIPPSSEFILSHWHHNKRNFIINWKGNSKNLHEEHNRKIDLNFLVTLFKNPLLNDIHWIVINKELDYLETMTLRENNIIYLGDQIDNDNAFQDSMLLIQNADGVITTDTSLAHISLNMNIDTYVLLTIGCEWRWVREGKTNWYPNAKLFRQKKLGDWEQVVNDLTSSLIS